VTSPADFSAFLADLRTRVEPLEREASDAWWQANVDSTPEAESRAAAAQKALTRFYADREAFAYLRSVDPAVLPPDDARQHTLLLNAYTGNQMDDTTIEELVDTERRVESAYNNFRPLLRGEAVSDNAVRDTLRASDDTMLRKEAWAASKEIGREVEKDVLRLVELRNREARRLGYPNYYRMALSLQEIEQDELFTLLDGIAAQTEDLWRAYKARLDSHLAVRFGVGVADLRPWHYADPFFQEAPPGEADLDSFYKDKDLEALTVAFFDAVGLEVRDILRRSDLYEKPNKSQHAFCVHVGRFDDVRVLCNITPSERWMGTMLHEFGHAVYDRYLGEDLPFFLKEVAHTLATEASAMFFGRLSRSAAFLERYAGVSPDEARAVAASVQGEASAQLLIFSRWVLVMTHFERALYENPAQDLNGLWWDLVARFQHVSPPEGRRDCPDWAAKLHIALSPVYYHNYLLGEMFASQMRDYVRTAVLPAGSDEHAFISNPAVGAYLRREVYAPGARLPWNKLIASATGEPLNPAHFVGHLR
jgi:peptidyl-dipeptidase A